MWIRANFPSDTEQDFLEHAAAQEAPAPADRDQLAASTSHCCSRLGTSTLSEPHGPSLFSWKKPEEAPFGKANPTFYFTDPLDTVPLTMGLPRATRLAEVFPKLMLQPLPHLPAVPVLLPCAGHPQLQQPGRCLNMLLSYTNGLILISAQEQGWQLTKQLQETRRERAYSKGFRKTLKRTSSAP